jgi:hypothetical protein
LFNWKIIIVHQYLNDWRLFESWLSNPMLNIQIKCLVNFAEHFYEPLIQFMVGQDPNLRIIQNDQLVLITPRKNGTQDARQGYD